MLYIFLWGLYYLQGTLYASGSIISQGILALLLCISLFYCYKVNVTYKLPFFFKVLNLFIITLSVYGILYAIDSEYILIENIFTQKLNKIEYLKTLYMSLLPIYAFFYFSKEQVLTPSDIRKISLFWLVVIIFSYIRRYNEMQALMIEDGFSEDVEITNNIAYDFLALFPLLFFWTRKPLVQYLLTFVLIVFIFSGMKRGAILIGVVCFIWFLYRMFKTSRGKGRAGIVLISLIILAVGISFVINLYETSPYFQLRVEQTLEGQSSGRDTIYLSLWNYYKADFSLMRFLFGNGANYSIVVAGNYAHNDWLELLINQGLLGIVLYAILFLSLVAFMLKNRNNNNFAILSMVFIIMFAMTLFSMLYANLKLPLAVAIGYCLAQDNKIVHY